MYVKVQVDSAHVRAAPWVEPCQLPPRTARTLLAYVSADLGAGSAAARGVNMAE